ncbi:hypothetical protein P879_03202 [Paragonimus westermani]|uniref:Niemann-Pick C1 protein n=1 Tax=Paragonimus westermani TaxID=34504 RepID=A0A8T0DYK8_9TREM|nr:hypothetical protein P879_03202 [Paragonimus westermani]
MPTDSYMLDYFNTLATELRVGPPLYFVVTEGHVYNETAGQNQVCGTVGCPQHSLMGQVSDASKIPSYTWIAQPAMSWIDDYFDWIDPEGSPGCCRVYVNGSGFCPDDAPSSVCTTCNVTLVDGRPNSEDFTHYLGRFLDQNPGVQCPKGGRAAYHSAVQLRPQNSVGATYFMTYHSVLSKPDDFLNGLRGSRRLADQINQVWRNGSSHTKTSAVLAPDSVYAYSVYYVFYEQYLNVVSEAIFQIGICLAAVTAVTFLLLGLNVAATAMVFLGVVYIVLSMLALMVLWNIDLNALSLVNLVVTIGIAVEFCAHIVRAFTVSIEPTRLARAKAALTNMGSSILRGITLTKLGGIVVLGSAKSRLFQIFYFRMYLGIIVFGVITGLIMIPVALSYIGPGLNKALAQKHTERLRERDVIEHTTTKPVQHRGD